MGPKSKKAIKPQTTQIPNETSAAGQPPNWPPLSPLVPIESLYIEPLVPSQIHLIRNLFTSSLCARYIAFLTTLPLITTPLTKSRDLAVRVNDRFQIEDPAFAAQLWSQTALKDLVLGWEDQADWGDGRGSSDPEILGLNPNIRVYRYRQGQFFDQHYDDSNNLSFRTEGKSVASKTTWTLLIYLSTCGGGDTVFYPDKLKGAKVSPDPVSVSPAVGLGLLHRHGERCMLHEGQKVTSGEKWVLRSDLVVKR